MIALNEARKHYTKVTEDTLKFAGMTEDIPKHKNAFQIPKSQPPVDFITDQTVVGQVESPNSILCCHLESLVTNHTRVILETITRKMNTACELPVCSPPQAPLREHPLIYMIYIAVSSRPHHKP